MTFRPMREQFRICGLLCAFQFLALLGLAQRSAFEDLLHRGFELHSQSKFAEAISVFEQARRLQAGDYFVNLLLGIDLLRVGKAADAVPYLKLAARTKPEEEFPEDYLGEAEASLGDQAMAAQAFQQAVLRGHNSEQSLEAWAGFALERFRAVGEELRSTDEGLAVARQLQTDSSRAGPEKLGCGESIPSLERKLALNPMLRDLDVAYRLSICYATEAGRAYERLQAGVSGDASVLHRLRGDVLLRLKGDAVAAKVEYRQALTTRRGDPQLLERLAEAQAAAGEPEDAKVSAQAALAIDPRRPAALHILSEIAMERREYDQAEPWLRQLVAQAPGDRADRVQLGRALLQNGHAEEAVQWLAPTLAAGYPDEKGALHALLASAFRRLGRDAEADSAAGEARRLSDSFQARTKPGDVIDGH